MSRREAKTEAVDNENIYGFRGQVDGDFISELGNMKIFANLWAGRMIVIFIRLSLKFL